MLLKNENASIRLDFVSYEFPETEYGMDEYDKNWLQLRCTWVDEDGYTHKDSNACLLAQELAGMNAGLKVLAAGIKDRYDSDFISSDLSLFAWAEGELFRVYISFYLPNTMDGDDTAELNCTLTGPELKALIEDLDQACAGSRSGNNRSEPQFLTANGKISIQDQQNEGGRRYEKADSHFPVPAPCVYCPRLREKERDQGDLRWKYKHLLRNEGRYLVLQ